MEGAASVAKTNLFKKKDMNMLHRASSTFIGGSKVKAKGNYLPKEDGRDIEQPSSSDSEGGFDFQMIKFGLGQEVSSFSQSCTDKNQSSNTFKSEISLSVPHSPIDHKEPSRDGKSH